MTITLGLITCGAYPAAVTLIGKVFFSEKVDGGVVFNHDGRIVGARLIGQNFKSAKYFHSRPSAAGDSGYDAANSGGTNFGPTSKKLDEALKKNYEQALSDNPNLKGQEIPVDMLTASASGLDPHISPENAAVQIGRVAQARKVSRSQITTLVENHTENRKLGVLGEPIVNVLLLNLALDENFPIR